VKPLRSIVAAVSMLAFTAAVESAPTGIEQADWRGSEEVLLTAGGDVYTEQDLLIYALLTETLDPATIRGWRSQPAERLEAIRNLLLSQAQTDWLAAQRSDTAPRDPALDALAPRIYAAPAARWLWADSVVRGSVTIFPEDLVREYKGRMNEFLNPGFATLRRLRVPYPPSITIETQNQMLREAEALKARGEKEGGLAGILQERPDYLLDPPGRTVEVRRDDKEVDEQLREAAFALGIGQISQPIRTPGGLILIEVVDRTTPSRIPLESVQEQLAESLRSRFIPQQFDYLLARRTVDAYATNNAHLYRFMPLETDIVRVRDFALTRWQFDLLHHDRVGAKGVSLLFIKDRANAILTNEVITQDLEEAGLLYDPFYDKALTVAERIHAAREVTRLALSKIAPTPEEVEAYLDANLEALAPGVARTIWRLDVYLRNPRGMSQGERDTMEILMRTYIRELITDASRQLDERRQLAANRGILEPDKVVNNLAAPDDLRVRLRFTKVGTVTRQDALQTTGLAFDQFTLGRFTPVVTTDDSTVSSYFVSDESPTMTPPRATLLESARRALIEERSVEGAMRHLEELRQVGRIAFHPDLMKGSGN